MYLLELVAGGKKKGSSPWSFQALFLLRKGPQSPPQLRILIFQQSEELLPKPLVDKTLGPVIVSKSTNN